MRPALFVLLLSLFVFGSLASAQPTVVIPGSVLLFPYYNANPAQGAATLISVTNTNGSRMVGPNNYRKGDVVLHYFYVDGDTCRITNRRELLTPNDILTVLASVHNPSMTYGYLYVYAEDPESGDAIQFNYLIGDAIMLDVSANELWSYNAIAFKGVMDEKTSPVRDRNDRIKTDVIANGGNANGSVDFNGVEYDFYPDELYLGSFLEERCTLRGRICLVSGLCADFQLELMFYFYDNEEDPYSRTFKFRCWECVWLQDISNVVIALGGSPNETPSGWARINGIRAINVVTGQVWRNEIPQGTNFDPPFIGIMTERIITAGFTVGRLLNWSGTQNGNEFPCDPVN
jgi:hypothetical protein